MVHYIFRYFIIFFLLFHYSVWAGQTGKIAGKVTDASSGEFLIGANIFLEGLPLGAASDDDGDYVILNIAPGTYTLAVLLIGYQEIKIRNVQVSIDRTTRIDFNINPTLLESEAIIVEATQPLIQRDLTASASTVSAKEISTIPVESLNDVLQLQAGIVVDKNGGIHLRGGRSNEIAYMVDGVSVSDPFNGSIAVNINQEAIQELKVISGTFNAEYGKVMSGVVEVITKDPEDEFHFGLTSYLGDYVSTHDKLFQNIDNQNPLDIYNMQLFMTGTLLLFNKKIGYYASLRRYYSSGHLYGTRRFNTADSSIFNPNSFHFEETGDGKSVPMNYTDQYFGNLKLTYQFSPVLKMYYNLLANTTRQRFYNHLYKYNPGGDSQNHEFGFTHMLGFNHTLSSNTFYTFKLSHYAFDLKSYLYEDLNDPGYQNPQLLVNREDAYSFYTGGTNLNHYYRTSTISLAKFDITSQVNKMNQVKLGLEYKTNLIEEESDQALYNGRESTIFSSASFLSAGKYAHTPFEISAYLQDKIELEKLTVNAGIRYDFFDSQGKVPRDLRDPGNTLRPADNAYRKAEPKHQFSPRIGLAFPLSASGVLHASYGHFFQIPDYRFLYQNSRFAVAPGGLNTLMGNTDLKPQSTVIYELGLQQEFAGLYGMHITGFYKDTRNLLGTNIYETYVLGDRYARYENRDYGNIKGITFSLKKFSAKDDFISFSLDYTFQIAEGNASDPNHVFNNNQGNPPKQSNIQVVPLDWDQTHTINTSVSYDNPDIISIGLIGQYQSGLPYTPAIQSIETSFENSGRMPVNFNVDMRFSKDVQAFGVPLTVFLKIYNVFDLKNELAVYNDTGRAGYSLIQRFLGSRQTTVNTLNDWIRRPDYYSEPRKVFLGITINL